MVVNHWQFSGFGHAEGLQFRRQVQATLVRTQLCWTCHAQVVQSGVVPLPDWDIKHLLVLTSIILISDFGE
jgi:hypothetical protein